MLVLLAEDSDTLREALTTQMRALGHEVHGVPNGWHAVLSYHAYQYDIILMDMHMPLMDGWDATQMIRDLEAANRKPRVPIVAITSLYDRQACLAGGMDDYLSKPHSQMQLYAVLTRWVMKKKAAAKSASEAASSSTATTPKR